MAFLNGQYRVPSLFTAFLSDDGSPSGLTNFTGDYSAGNITEAFWQAPPGFLVEVTGIQFLIGGGGTFSQTQWGSVGPLTVGLDIRGTFNGVDIDLTTDNLKSNNDLLGFGVGATSIANWQGAAADSISSSLNLVEHTGAKVYLNGNTGDKIRVVVNDNFTGLQRHNFVLRGRL